MPFLFYSLLLLIVIFILVYIFIGRPIESILKTIETDNLYYLKSITNKSNELHRLAAIPIKVFQEKTALLAEISEREKNENVIRKSEEKYRILVETFPNAVLLLSNEGKILLCNQSVFSILRFENMNLIEGHSFFDFFPTDEISNIKQLFYNLNGKSKLIDIECTMIRGNDQQFPSELSISKINSDTGLSDNFIVVFKDITDRKKSEAEKNHLEEQFRAIFKMEAIGQLAGGVAHDFNNIIGAISGYADIIKIKYKDDEKLLKYAQMIFSAANRASDLTNKLLTFARKNKMKMISFDAHNLLKEAICQLKHSFDKNVCIIRDFQASDSVILGDPNQFQIVVMNIAINARDAMPEGGQLIFKTGNKSIDSDFVKTRAFTINPGYYFFLSIMDSGCGMDKKTLSHVFEPFFTTKDIGKGTGLGLASAYGIIKSHNGYIDVSSDPGKGSNFTLYIPAVYPQIPEKISHQTRTPNDKFHIMVAEDESFMRDAMKEMLSWMGYDVSICSDGIEAVEFFKANHEKIDLVILDMAMPGMNGIEVSKKLREINKNAKIILATGYLLEDERCDIFDMGILGIVQKPFVSAQLAHAVHNALSK